jgi:beta-lactamase class D
MTTTLIKFATYIFALLICTAGFSKERLLVLDNQTDQILCQIGDQLEERVSPWSTFKIVLSLMGFNENILIDEFTPEWSFVEGYYDFLPKWRAAHIPKLWMYNSCVWYSHVLVQKLGQNTIEGYLSSFDYGNQDFSGDPGKNNAMERAWLGSSLKISPLEQASFLKKLIANNLPVSSYAMETTKKILFLNDLENGWKLYGKTGSGTESNEERENTVSSWFIGWIEKGPQQYIFVWHLESTRIPTLQERIELITDYLKKMDILH